MKRRHGGQRRAGRCRAVVPPVRAEEPHPIGASRLRHGGLSRRRHATAAGLSMPIWSSRVACLFFLCLLTGRDALVEDDGWDFIAREKFLVSVAGSAVRDEDGIASEVGCSKFALFN